MAVMAVMLVMLACSLPGQEGGEGGAAEPTATVPDFATMVPEEGAGSLIGTFIEVNGDVTVQAPGADFATAAAGMTITQGSLVRTGADGRVRLDLSDGTIMRIAPNTEFMLGGWEQDPATGGLITKVQLVVGTIFGAISGGSMDVDTPSGVASVRGSMMEVRYDPVTGVTYITCLEGVCTLRGGGSEATIYAGQSARLSDLGIDVSSMTEDEFDTWLALYPNAADLIAQLRGASASATQLAQASALTGAQCMEGTWSISSEAIQAYVSSTVMGGGIDINLSVLGGGGTLQITDSQMFASAQGVNVQVTSAGVSYSVSGSGTASGNYTADDAVINLTGIVYSGQATLVEPVRTSELDLTGLLNFVQSLGFGAGFSSLPLEMGLSYTCGANILTVRINPHATVTLSRVAP